MMGVGGRVRVGVGVDEGDVALGEDPTRVVVASVCPHRRGILALLLALVGEGAMVEGAVIGAGRDASEGDAPAGDRAAAVEVVEGWWRGEE